MAGAIVFAVAMIVVVPVGVMLGGALWSGAFGWFSSESADRSADRSEGETAPTA